MLVTSEVPSGLREYHSGGRSQKQTKMGSEMRHMDKFFSRTTVTEPLKKVINIVPADTLTLNWGDKSPPFARARKLCEKKRQKIEKQIHVFVYLEHIKQHKMAQ